MKMPKTCKGYIGVTCVNGNCPVAVAEEQGYYLKMDCANCFYNMGCEDCAAPFYGLCERGNKND